MFGWGQDLHCTRSQISLTHVFHWHSLHIRDMKELEPGYDSKGPFSLQIVWGIKLKSNTAGCLSSSLTKAGWDFCLFNLRHVTCTQWSSEKTANMAFVFWEDHHSYSWKQRPVMEISPWDRNLGSKRRVALVPFQGSVAGVIFERQQQASLWQQEFQGKISVGGPE